MICIRHYPYARGGVQNNNNNIVRACVRMRIVALTSQFRKKCVLRFAIRVVVDFLSVYLQRTSFYGKTDF